jgi:hypothetical protein
MNLLDLVFDEPGTKLAETFLTVGELAVTQLFFSDSSTWKLSLLISIPRVGTIAFAPC